MAKNEQKSFLLYIDSYPDISMLNQEQKGDLLDGIYAFHGACECPELDQATAIVLMVAALALFIAFYPLESGLPVAREYAQYLRWFKWVNF